MKLRSALRVTAAGAITGTMLPGLAVHRQMPWFGSAARDKWVSSWSGAILRVFRVTEHVSGKIPTQGAGRLVVSNHRSALDILLLLRLFGGRLVSRRDLSNWPLIGAAARAAGTVFVDRADAMSGAKTIRSIRDFLRQGDIVCVFAEGTTYADDLVRPFHAGAFVAAAASQEADILPVGIAYAQGSEAAFLDESFPSHLSRIAGAQETHVAISIGETIPVGKTRAAALKELTQVAVQRLVLEARDRI